MTIAPEAPTAKPQQSKESPSRGTPATEQQQQPNGNSINTILQYIEDPRRREAIIKHLRGTHDADPHREQPQFFGNQSDTALQSTPVTEPQADQEVPGILTVSIEPLGPDTDPEVVKASLPGRLAKLRQRVSKGFIPLIATSLVATGLAMSRPAPSLSHSETKPVPSPDIRGTDPAPRPLSSALTPEEIHYALSQNPTIDALTSYAVRNSTDMMVIAPPQARDMLNYIHTSLNYNNLTEQKINDLSGHILVLNDEYINILLKGFIQYNINKQFPATNTVPQNQILIDAYRIFSERPENITDELYEAYKMQAALNLLNYLYINNQPLEANPTPNG